MCLLLIESGCFLFLEKSPANQENFIESYQKSIGGFVVINKHYADMGLVIGNDVITGAMIRISEEERRYNNIVLGSIGHGSLATVTLPIIKQDLDNMTHYINLLTSLKKECKDDEVIQGRFISSITLLGTSKQLCEKVFQLAKANGLKDESITYIDPNNPNSPGINIMNGTTDEVLQAFQMLINTFESPFIRASLHEHLFYYLSLLKEHKANQSITIDMLVNMYNDTQLVHIMHKKLKKRIELELPNEHGKVKQHDENDHWQLIKKVDKWFDDAIVPLKDDEDSRFMDTSEKYIKGLRTLLNDIVQSPFIRRMLFNPSAFNFEKHMEDVGRVVLVHLDKDKLPRWVRKTFLKNIQNAVFLRKHPTTFNHLIVDDADDLLYQEFLALITQSPLFKVNITLSISQLKTIEDRFGKDYVDMILINMRNRFYTGGLSIQDTKNVEEAYRLPTVTEQIGQFIYISPQIKACNVKPNFVKPEDFIESVVKVLEK